MPSAPRRRGARRRKAAEERRADEQLRRAAWGGGAAWLFVCCLPGGALGRPGHAAPYLRLLFIGGIPSGRQRGSAPPTLKPLKGANIWVHLRVDSSAAPAASGPLGRVSPWLAGGLYTTKPWSAHGATAVRARFFGPLVNTVITKRSSTHAISDQLSRQYGRLRVEAGRGPPCVCIAGC